MSRFSTILLGALAITAMLGWFAAEMIANRRPADAIDVLPVTPLAPDALTRIALTAECEELKSNIQRDVLTSGQCTVDADCVALRMNCPFACASAINSESFAGLYERNRLFSSNCGRCLAPCTEQPRPVLCRRGRCAFELIADELIRPESPPVAPGDQDL